MAGLKLEVVVYNIESALKAQEGGADRIELCADPGSGGTTPSYGTIELVRQNISFDLFVMIRPRGGDFFYSSYEFHSMKRDITQVQKLSADGIVTGILTKEGDIDVKRCKELIDRARPLKVTCHRAFDRTRDPLQALEDCIEAGFDRILTSGQKRYAPEGIPLLKQLQAQAKGRIIIMPGSGVTAENAASIIRNTGVTELHFSASATRRSEMLYTGDTTFSMGTENGQEFVVRTVDPGKIREIRASVMQEPGLHFG